MDYHPNSPLDFCTPPPDNSECNDTDPINCGLSFLAIPPESPPANLVDPLEHFFDFEGAANGAPSSPTGFAPTPARSPPAEDSNMSAQNRDRNDNLRLVGPESDKSTPLSVDGSDSGSAMTSEGPVVGGENPTGRALGDQPSSTECQGRSPTALTITVDFGEKQTLYKVQLTTKLGAVIEHFCNHNNLEAGALRFLLDGKRVNPNDTPNSLEMADGDSLFVALEQIGG